jgi:hypothetical protein
LEVHLTCDHSTAFELRTLFPTVHHYEGKTALEKEAGGRGGGVQGCNLPAMLPLAASNTLPQLRAACCEISGMPLQLSSAATVSRFEFFSEHLEAR